MSDKQIKDYWQPIKAPEGMFFCEACLRDLPLNERSEKDMRYCNFCQVIIEAENAKSVGGYRDYWSECGQVFFCGGKGFGLTDALQSICLGSEDSIKKFFETGELNNELRPSQRQVLNGILDYRKEQGIGTNTGAANMERAGNNGASRHKPKATRLLASRKRLPMRPSRTKGKSLSRK